MTEPAVRIDVPVLMEQLAQVRPLFHSEADFQHALAWAVRERYGDAQIRLEVPAFPRTRDRLDVQVLLDGYAIPVEVKYWKGRLVHTTPTKEEYRLANRGAQDIERAGFIRDIARVEEIVPGQQQGGSLL